MRVGARFPDAFLGFFDDAAVFPPGLAPLEQAISDHIQRRKTPLDTAVGPLILPLQAIAEAQALAAGQDLSSGPVVVSIVVPAGELTDALSAWQTVGPELHIAALELKVSTAAADWTRQIEEAKAVEGVAVYVELTAEQVADGALDALAEAGLRLKFRTGGIQQHLFPTVSELGAVIMAAVTRGLPFKLTAGLHQAIRYNDPTTGFTHHGFLNIAAAAAAARNGAPTGQVEAALGETDAARLLDLLDKNSAGSLDPSWRASFVSFGTCSVLEPAESLEALALLDAGLLVSDQSTNHIFLKAAHHD
ncbi:hypothetical protein ART_3466 [Arthrobacter sp. PAMC 25486]|nr:hypothetical protein ART_3466 [Arthrobacter sp. PAMC 25486]